MSTPLTREQREKAIALAVAGVSRADTARCLGLDRSEFDSTISGDRTVINAFGQGRVATQPSRGYTEVVRFCAPDRVAAHLSVNGITVERDGSTFRARCACATTLAVLQTNARGVSWGELSRVKEYLVDCDSCSSAKRARARQSARR